jgi:hypothetical protein
VKRAQLLVEPTAWCESNITQAELLLTQNAHRNRDYFAGDSLLS